MLQVNNEWVYEDLDEKNIIELVETFRKGETPKWGPQISRNFSEGPEGRTCLVKEFNIEYKIDRDFGAAKKQWEEKIQEEARKKAEMEAKKKEQAKAAEDYAQKAKVEKKDTKEIKTPNQQPDDEKKKS
jgi:hypothetical protein